ncbi:MAG: 50S ribosomal protein L21e [Candidatus Micrarchaeota archaeon]
MVKHSSGLMSGRTRNLGASSKTLTPVALVQKYGIGSLVSIKPNIKYSGSPHGRFRGLTGEIVNKRGNAYEVEIRVGNAIKILIIPAVHLKLKV